MTLSRQELAASFSALRRVAPRVPFWCLAAHRIPTLWSLYRGLLRAASHGSEHVRWRMRTLFRLRSSCTSPSKTQEYLTQGHRWLDVFQAAVREDNYCRAVMTRYDRMIAAKREQEAWKTIFREELGWINKLRSRPIMTGTPVRPTLYNKPLPRLKPQPIHISGMIASRRRARARRMETQERLWMWRDDLRHEHAFEAGLLRAGAKFQPVFHDLSTWTSPLDKQLRDVDAAFMRDDARARTPYSPELLATLKEARREKIRNKTRERERERRGEILASTVRRMRKGPPAHILARMTPEQRARDRVLRMPGEAGYTGSVKRAAGMKMRGGDGWRREDT